MNALILSIIYERKRVYLRNVILFLKELLWVAPELLADHATSLTPATQKGDVYSFAIVLEEIVVRGGPYEFVKNDLTTQGNIFQVILTIKLYYFVNHHFFKI